MIEIGSKWKHKDGGVYDVICNGSLKPSLIQNTFMCIWYRDQQGEIYVRTEKHFLQSFKPYELIYEYRWASNDGAIDFISTCFYKDEEEFLEMCAGATKINQRLDFTKRERK